MNLQFFPSGGVWQLATPVNPSAQSTDLSYCSLPLHYTLQARERQHTWRSTFTVLWFNYSVRRCLIFAHLSLSYFMLHWFSLQVLHICKHDVLHILWSNDLVHSYFKFVYLAYIVPYFMLQWLCLQVHHICIYGTTSMEFVRLPHHVNCSHNHTLKVKIHQHYLTTVRNLIIWYCPLNCSDNKRCLSIAIFSFFLAYFGRPSSFQFANNNTAPPVITGWSISGHQHTIRGGRAKVTIPSLLYKATRLLPRGKYLTLLLPYMYVQSMTKLLFRPAIDPQLWKYCSLSTSGNVH